MKIQLRRNQLELSKKSAAMAIFLGKNYLGQKDSFDVDKKVEVEDLMPLAEKLRMTDDESNADNPVG